MMFAGAQNADASHGTFNSVQNQYNCTIQLESAFSAVSSISSLVQQVQNSKEQLQVLAASIDTLLKTLNVEYGAGRPFEAKNSSALENLTQLIEDIHTFVHKESATEFMKSLTKTDARVAQIADYYHQLDKTIASFQIASFDIQDWQTRNQEARLKDKKALDKRLDDLASNQNDLKKMFREQNHSLEAMIVSLRTIIEERLGGDRELDFFRTSVRLLTEMTRYKDLKNFRRESWMITSFDIEFGREIGSGGYARVLEGTWNKTPVAVKILKSSEGVTPSFEALRREITTWSGLLHPNILQFLGANDFDDMPFIVAPLMKNGNARMYIRNNQYCDRLKILYDVSLGMVYLHSQNIVHGDLKAQNVLIDDGGRALLCDFGLARLKADVTTRTTESNFVTVPGSRHWMAPERLMGKALRRPSDIYSFGITSYEIYTEEIPFGNINPAELRDLVVNHHVRPERPDDDEAPHFTDEIWQLAERCWASDPLSRPSGSAVCDDIRCILDRRTSSQAASELKPKAGEIGPDRQDIDSEPRVLGEVQWNELFNSSTSSLPSANSLSHIHSKTNPTPLRSTSCPRDTKSISHNTASSSSTSARSSSAPSRSSSGSSTCDSAQPTTQSASKVTAPSFLNCVGGQTADDSTHSRSSCGSSTSDAQLTTRSAAEVATPSLLKNIARHTANDSTLSRSSSGSPIRDAKPATHSAPEVVISPFLNSTAKHTADDSSPSSCSSSGPPIRDTKPATQSAPEVAISPFLNNIARYTADDDDTTLSCSSSGSSTPDAQPATPQQSATQLTSEVANSSILGSIARHTLADSSTPEHTDSIPLELNTEPGPQWKQALRKGIEECLFPLYADAREIVDQKLKEAPIHDEVAREIARREHDSAYKDICRIAEILYREETESERQQLRWLAGQSVDSDWLEGIVRYQKAIMEKSQAVGEDQ